MSEFIGARIALISKSDIRYVGILHEINSENSTVALEQVVSFGTEGRRGDPAKEIAATSNVYEYIVFRGSDVKDLRIEEAAKPSQQQPPPQVPDDPAILTSTARPPPAQPHNFQHQQPHQPQQMQQPQFAQGMHPYYPPNPQVARFGGYTPYNGFYSGYAPMGPPGSQQFVPPNAQQQQFQRQIPPGQAPIGPVASRPQPPVPVHQPGQVNQPIGQPAGPRGSMPFSQNQPVLQQQQAQAPTQVPSKAPDLPEHAANKPTTPAAAPQAIPLPAPVEDSKEQKATNQSAAQPEVPAPALPTAQTQGVQQPPKPTTNGSTGPKGHSGIVPALPLASAGQPSPADSSAVPAPAPATAKPTAVPAATNEPKVVIAINEASAAVSQLETSAVQPDVQRPTRQPNNRGRGGFRGGHHVPRKIEIPAADFDFQSANAKFNKQDLIKEVIASEEISSPIGNGSSASVNGSKSADEAEAIIQPTEQPYYSKQKSFFDNISCENKERAEAKDGEKRGGASWRGEEVKKNIETFGQGSVDASFHRYGRGNGYRGRGRGRGGYRGRVYNNRGVSPWPQYPNSPLNEPA